MGAVPKKVSLPVPELGVFEFVRFAKQWPSQNSSDSVLLNFRGLEADLVLLRVHSFVREVYLREIGKKKARVYRNADIHMREV